MEKQIQSNAILIMKKEQPIKREKSGRPSLYGEETKTVGFCVPLSKVEIIECVVKAMLKSYEKCVPNKP